MNMDDMSPRGGDGMTGSGREEHWQQEAERDRLAKETEEIHAEEAAERGEAPAAKAPWWKFWASR
jgi:hypothetical protein